MAHFPHGAIVAVHAANEKRRKDQEEELEMTNYSTEDLEGDWEFKIVRSSSAAFHRPQVFQQLMHEESLAGWELVEKLDDSRVRFKRHRDSRSKDANLPPGLDPYRTQYGANPQKTAIVVGLGLMLTLTAVGFLLIYRLAPEGGDAPILTTVGTIPVIIVLVGISALIAARRRNR